MDRSRNSRITVYLVAIVFVVVGIGAVAAIAADRSELKDLVGTWVWHHMPTCAQCQPFTLTLVIAGASPDGRLRARCLTPKAPRGVPVQARATVTDGRVKVAFGLAGISYDLEYLKNLDSLRGPVDGFPIGANIDSATFLREK
jgi:hypothetical protein